MYRPSKANRTFHTNDMGSYKSGNFFKILKYVEEGTSQKGFLIWPHPQKNEPNH